MTSDCEQICHAQEIKALRYWRPIATAPKDGSYILLAALSDNNPLPLHVEFCRWHTDYLEEPSWCNRWDASFNNENSTEPTHWAPLFLIPEAAS